MRKAWLLAIALVLLAAALPVHAADISPVPGAVRPAAPQSPLLPTQPAPRPATAFLCGTCSGTCSGLFTGSACDDGGSPGTCIGVVTGGSQRPAQCPAGSGTGNLCFCQSFSDS